MQKSGPEVNTVQIPVCILPVVDATGGKGIDLLRYSKAHKLPAAKSGGYFPANYAFRDFKLWQYTKPFYNGGDCDVSVVYQSAQKGEVALSALPKDGSPEYYVLIAVRQFEQFFRVLWRIEGKVDVFVVQASTGKVVCQLKGEASEVAGIAAVIDRGLIVPQDYPDFLPGGETEYWQRTICCAVTDALKKMPILQQQ